MTRRQHQGVGRSGLPPSAVWRRRCAAAAGAAALLLAAGCAADAPAASPSAGPATTGPASAGPATTAPATTAPATAAPTSTASTSTGDPSESAAPSRRPGSTSPSAPPTTPTPGSTAKTVAPRTQPTRKPVKLKATSRFSSTLTATVSDVSSRTVKAKYPGEVSGPSVLFTLTITNSSGKAVDLNSLVVNVVDDELAPGNRITSPPASTMPRVVGPGRTVRGRYVFVLPRGSRNPITVETSVSAEKPVLVFRGPVG